MNSNHVQMPKCLLHLGRESSKVLTWWEEGVLFVGLRARKKMGSDSWLHSTCPAPWIFCCTTYYASKQEWMILLEGKENKAEETLSFLCAVSFEVLNKPLRSLSILFSGMNTTFTMLVIKEWERGWHPASHKALSVPHHKELIHVLYFHDHSY